MKKIIFTISMLCLTCNSMFAYYGGYGYEESYVRTGIYSVNPGIAIWLTLMFAIAFIGLIKLFHINSNLRKIAENTTHTSLINVDESNKSTEVEQTSNELKSSNDDEKIEVETDDVEYIDNTKKDSQTYFIVGITILSVFVISILCLFIFQFQ